jgi:sporulation protein YlmC with PRC-barrel domain
MKEHHARRRTPQQMHAHACIPSLVGAPLADRDGAVVGTVEDLMVALATQAPTWLLVRLHGAGAARRLVPASGMHAGGAAVRVPYAAAEIAAAPPGPPATGGVVAEHAVRLCRHYRLRLPPETWAGEVRALHPPAPAAVAAAA